VKDVGETLSTFVWFFVQSITVGGLGVFWFLVPFVLLVSIMVWKFPRKEIKVRGLVSLLILPFLWIFIGIWGAYFWLDWQTAGATNPEWVQIPINTVLPLSAVVGVLLIIFLKGARAFAAAFTIANLYFVLAMSFLASMATSGIWL